MRKSNSISAVILLGLATITLFEGSKLSFGSLRKPGSGFFAMFLATVLAGLSLILLGQSIKERDEEKSSFRAILGNWKKTGITVGALFVCAFLFEWIGYLVSSFLLIVFLMRAIEPRKWWLVITVAFLSSLVSYLVFDVLLGVSLPIGILGI